MTKKMTRKEFLTYLGMFFLAITGISKTLKNISKFNPKSKKLISKPHSSAFGSRAYGV